MIYLASSVALARLLAEDHSPPDALCQRQLISSRLLEYEVRNRIHARRLNRSHGDVVRALIGRVALPPTLCATLPDITNNSDGACDEQPSQKAIAKFWDTAEAFPVARRMLLRYPPNPIAKASILPTPTEPRFAK